LMLIVSVLSFSMSYSPPIGHFNLAKIGHYYFALTLQPKPKKNIMMSANGLKKGTFG